MHELNTGAAALQALLAAIGEISDSTCMDDIDSNADDTRDYESMAQAVRASIEANLQHHSLAHREGYLRALTHLLCLNADGCGPGDNWAPIDATEAAFNAPRVAADVIRQARR